MPIGSDRPKVFLSFAGNDRAAAQRLAEDLRLHGVEPFVDTQAIAPGSDVILSINTALTESDYYVLLWSRHCVDRPWVQVEWTAAYARQVVERRAFFFIVRLDETPLPTLLAVRKYLDAFPTWGSVAADLASAWRADLAIGTPVFPSPVPARSTAMAMASSIVLYVRNRAFGMSHVVAVPADATGGELEPVTRSTLALPDERSELDGALGMRFAYELIHDGEPIPDKPLDILGIRDGTVIDLEMRVEAYGPDGPIGAKVYRTRGDGTVGVSDDAFTTLIEDAIEHLLP